MPQQQASSPSTSSAPPRSAQHNPLAQALVKNEAAKEEVEQSANELVVIHAVLKQEIPPEVQTGEVAQALRKTDELETRVTETVADLAQVNETLAQQVEERVELERELSDLESELVRTKAALAEARKHA